MIRMKISLVLVIGAVVLLLNSGLSHAATYGDDWEIRKITDNSASESDVNPCLSGGRIAWQGNVSNGNYQIYYWDGATTQNISDNSVSNYGVSSHDGKVAWYSYADGNSNIYCWDGGTTQKITDTSAWSGGPSVYGEGIAWLDGSDGNNDIYYWDGITAQNISNNTSSSNSSISLNGGKIAWYGDATGDGEIYYWDGVTVQNISLDNVAYDCSPSLYDGEIAWRSNADGDSDIYLWDGTTTQKITNNSVSDYSPSLYDGKIAWYGPADGDDEIYFWDGTTIHQITDNSAADTSPSLYEGQIAWQSNVDGDNEIYLATNTEYYVTSLMDSLGDSYSQEEIDAIVALYAGADEETTVTIGGDTWNYLSGILPGDIGGTTYAIGDIWEFEGVNYIKLGSGLAQSGAVPELPPFAAQGLILAFGSISIWVRRRRVKVSKSQSVSG